MPIEMDSNMPARGDRVKVVVEPHMKGHVEGVVRQVVGGALGIEFDGAPGAVHQWYVASEVMVIEPAAPTEGDAEENPPSSHAASRRTRALERRLLSGGNRIYWRDCDFPRIAERFGVEPRELGPLVAPEVPSHVIELTIGEPSSDEFRFALSSNAVDTYGDTINQMGWDYKRFDKNPVALQFHRGSTLPIGTWSKRGVENGMLKASLRFSSDRDAKRIEHQVRERTLRMTSVGFMPGEWKWSDDPKRKYGIDFIEGHVLLEASVVSIGANPDALLEADAPGLTQNENGSSKTTPAPQSGAKSFSLELARLRATALAARL